MEKKIKDGGLAAIFDFRSVPNSNLICIFSCYIYIPNIVSISQTVLKILHAKENPRYRTETEISDGHLAAILDF